MTRKQLKYSARGGLVVLLVIAAGCSQSQIVSTLTGVVSAIEIVLPVIAKAAGIPPATVSQIESYLTSVNDAAAQASDILAGPGTPSMKAAKITALFAGIVAPKLPPGTPREILDAVDQVARAVAKFLANFSSGQFATRAETAKPAEVSDADKEKLHKLQSRSLALQAQIGALRKH